MLIHRLIEARLGKGPSLVRKTSAGLLLIRRQLIHAMRPRGERANVLFIFGCQRSGTTLLSRIFEGDVNVCSFAEHSSQLSRRDHRLRTRPLPELDAVFDKCRGSLIVAKPLVESQRATEFMSYFPNACAVWSFRHYKDVVLSYVKIFDRAGVNIMKKILDNQDNWASEKVSDESKAIVSNFYREDMSSFDAAALFWLVRNRLYFEQSLETEVRMTTCQYADLTSNPDLTMQRIYSFAGIDYPGSHLVAGVHGDSRGLGRSLVLDAGIETLCEEMLAKLIAVNDRLTEPAPHAENLTTQSLSW